MVMNFVPKGIIIRLATENDLQAVFGLMSALGYPDLSLARFGEIYHAVVKDASMFLVLAEADYVVIGLATVSRRPQLRLNAHLVTIDELVVAPEWRGRGVGRALVEQAKGIARHSGCGRLELLTNRARESYRREFYIQNGFTEADSAVMRIDYELGNEW
jgi:N-acetylglutamate synthase-like GNAT family acetyltransferase